jgi:CubicO group peptidase (beta-lactamase class C family)
VCAYVGGELVVDTWAGSFDGSHSEAVDGGTIFPIFSVSKSITATALHIQARRGLIDYDAPVAAYWPEYGVNGKAEITVRQVLSHRAGVPQMPDGVTPELMIDWDWMTARLAEMEPAVPPGTKNTYLSMTFGWLVGEVVRRTDPEQRSFADFVREEICEPLRMDSYFLGVPESERERIATLEIAKMPPPLPEGSLVKRATPEAVRLLPPAYNRDDVHGGVVPAVGAIANARALARFYAMIAGEGEFDGVRLLDREQVRGFLEPRPEFEEFDETYGKVMPVGVAGFWLRAPEVVPAAAARRILAHPGAGSTIAWADLDSGLAGAITHNRMFSGLDPAPFAAIGEALREIAAG